MSKKVLAYDVTLRDGTQGEGVSFSIEDKIRVSHKIDELGVAYIEGGWPGSNDRDEGFFKKAWYIILLVSYSTFYFFWSVGECIWEGVKKKWK